MFSKNDLIYFVLAGLLIATGLMLMVIDPVENGFGVFTLWMAPPVLIAGFLLPIRGIIGVQNPVLGNVFRDRLQTSGGVLIFASALTTYVVTLEPTASLWDCSEFIASSYKLQVPHTPGTPLALLIGRLFSMMSMGNAAKVAWTINLMSGVFSAGAVYLFYQISFYIGQHVTQKGPYQRMIILVSSMSAALCLAFSDTFWFSAVEAETYGLACFFLLLLVWLIMTGRDLTQPLRSRRLLLIAYIAGLSYCVHPMCLLALPMLPFAWLTTCRPLSLRITMLLVAAGILLVFLINRFIAIGIFQLAFIFDRFFVNSFHLPFYSGLLILIAALILFIRFLVARLSRVQIYVWCVVFLIMGFMPYLVLFIRSGHNPPIDETNPEDLALIKAYVNRESYPTSPLLFGPYFDARIEAIEEGKKMYFKGEKRYEVAGTSPRYRYNARQTILPRMYSNDPAHIIAYRSWTGLREDEKPGFSDNVEFMLRYQLGHMYFRYLMWNFAGRKGDEQNSGWLRPWDKLKESPHERARNQYWMMPLLLGLGGAFFQYRRRPKEFVNTMILFLLTGLVLALYLNAPPNEPRERDYIYVGSFIAFAIWIASGLTGLGEIATRKRPFIFLFCIFSLSLPLWMLYQNYDDHDRSGRTFQVDNARNILASCRPNSILFTGGDNDTFPLWYLQEVEGFRTDVRVMVLSYMNTDWYIKQLTRGYYDSPPFKLTLNEDDYRQYGPNDVLYVQETISHAIDVRQFLGLLKSKHPALARVSEAGESYHIVPSKTLSLGIGQSSSSVVNRSGASAPGPHALPIQLKENYIQKNLLALLDLVVSNGWQRPVHFNFTSLNTLGVDLSAYVIQEGAVFRLRSERSEGTQIAVDTSLSYRHLVSQANYSNLANTAVYLSYEDHYARMLVPIRQSFNDLAGAFLAEGNFVMAREVLKQGVAKLYHKHLPPSYTNLEASQMLMALQETELAEDLSETLFEFCYDRAKGALEAGDKPSNLDVYLLRSAAELFDSAGNDSYIRRLSGLGM